MRCSRSSCADHANRVGIGPTQGRSPKEVRMRIRPALMIIMLAALWVAVASRPGSALEAGEPAPDFTLASTTGGDISLSDFRGKKWVLLEFYGADFAPT